LGAFLDSLLGGANETRTPGGLSRREQEVLASLLQNLSNKEIAVRLNISERTVKFHVSNLLSKFSVQRRADLLVQSLGRFAS
jgi:DNA-binding CsgD family transcriptional regulator